MVGYERETMVEVRAIEHIVDSGSIAESGIALGVVIEAELKAGKVVRVSLKGMKGLSSSYFNPILARIKRNFGLDILGDRLIFAFDSKAQQTVFDRSLAAVQVNVP